MSFLPDDLLLNYRNKTKNHSNTNTPLKKPVTAVTKCQNQSWLPSRMEAILDESEQMAMRKAWKGVL
jgi:hypothetical protein